MTDQPAGTRREQPDPNTDADPDTLLAELRAAIAGRAQLRTAADHTVTVLADSLIDHLDHDGRLPRAWSSNPTPDPRQSPADLASMGLICTCGASTDAGCACATWVWNDHANDIGDWCPWSGRVAEATDIADGDNAACPARCHASRIVEAQ